MVLLQDTLGHSKIKSDLRLTLYKIEAPNWIALAIVFHYVKKFKYNTVNLLYKRNAF